MTTINLKRYKYIREEIQSKPVEISNETQYFFQTGIRRAIRIEPIWSQWKQAEDGEDEEIYEYRVTLVYGSFECKIEVITIKGYLNSLGDQYYSEVDNSVNSFVKAWLDDEFDVRTKEQFEADLNQAFNVINYEK